LIEIRSEEIALQEHRLSFLENLRKRLFEIASEWEQSFGNAPHITTVLSENDAADVLDIPLDAYCNTDERDDRGTARL
jgi:hypothetical protein